MLSAKPCDPSSAHRGSTSIVASILSSSLRHLSAIVFGVVSDDNEMEYRETAHLIRERANLIGFGAKLAKEAFDGIITNDKFCYTRRARLMLRPLRHPPQPCHHDPLSSCSALTGGVDETCMDGSPPPHDPPTRPASLGPGLLPAGSMGDCDQRVATTGG